MSNPDDKPPMPEQPDTGKLAATPEWGALLIKTVSEGFTRVEANLSLVSSDLEVVKGRVSNLEAGRALDEQRSTAQSLKAQGLSENDLAHEAKLADVILWRQTVDTKLSGLEAKTDAQTTILTRIDDRASAILRNPRVQALVWAVIAFATAWLGRHT